MVSEKMQDIPAIEDRFATQKDLVILRLELERKIDAMATSVVMKIGAMITVGTMIMKFLK